MKRDQGLAERLGRAADAIRVDPEDAMAAFERARGRREALRRGSAIGVALAVALLGLGVVWWVWPGAGGTSPGGPTGPSGAAAGPSGTIAYMVMTEDGAASSLGTDEIGGPPERTSLPAAGNYAAYPVWSPDGTMIAYASGEDYGTLELTVARADGSQARALGVQVHGPLFAWSPTGEALAYVGWDDSMGSEVVAVVGLDGGEDRVVSAWAAVQSVSWSPDGSRLLVTGHPASEEGVAGPEGFDVYSLALDGTDLRQLTHTTEYEHWASWSPDGSRIVFTRSPEYDDADYPQDVWIMKADGSDPQRLTDWRGFDSFPVWSPDGRWIAFASDRDATPGEQVAFRKGERFSGVSIFVMRVDGTDLGRVLTAGEDEVLLPSSWKS